MHKGQIAKSPPRVLYLTIRVDRQGGDGHAVSITADKAVALGSPIIQTWIPM